MEVIPNRGATMGEETKTMVPKLWISTEPPIELSTGRTRPLHRIACCAVKV